MCWVMFFIDFKRSSQKKMAGRARLNQCRDPITDGSGQRVRPNCQLIQRREVPLDYEAGARSRKLETHSS